MLLAGLLGAGCDGGGDRLPEHVLAGEIMGTTFSVKIVAADDLGDKESLGRKIRESLETVDRTMSTYRPESDLSLFNASTSTDWSAVPMALCRAVSAALDISRWTGGAFDITIGRLVNLWGFGPDDIGSLPPADEPIAEALRNSGYQKLSADCGRPALRKTRPGMYVDLSGYAKGYAVDELASLLDELHFENYLVEIGGEIRVRGNNASGADWAIAIERPAVNERAVQTIVKLSDMAMATSGDYRNFFEFEGRRYSHTIDPSTGRPVTHDGASVTVVDRSTALADGLATALLVMGPDDGIAFAEQHDVAAYYMVHSNGDFENRMSTRFAGLVR